MYENIGALSSCVFTRILAVYKNATVLSFMCNKLLFKNILEILVVLAINTTAVIFAQIL